MERQRQKAVMVVFDDAGPVPSRVWDAPDLSIDQFAGWYYNQPGRQRDRKDWEREYMQEFTYRGQWKPEATDADIARCQTRCAWKGGGPCLASDCPRKDLAARGESAADSCKALRADRQDLAPEPMRLVMPDGTAREATEAAIQEYGEQMLERIHKRSRSMVMGMLAASEKDIEFELTDGRGAQANTASGNSQLTTESYQQKGGGDDHVHAGLQSVPVLPTRDVYADAAKGESSDTQAAAPPDPATAAEAIAAPGSPATRT